MATVAAAIAARSRRDAIAHFMMADAVRPTAAVHYDPARRIDQRTFARLKASGVLKPAVGDLWYLDIPAYHANCIAREKRAAVIFAIVGTIALVVLLVLLLLSK